MSDRFEEMRSKGTNTNDADAVASDIAMGKTAYVKGKKITGTSSGGGGGDYSAIGTTVTVEAQGAIAKGARWEGVKSEDYEITVGLQQIDTTGITELSDDLEVGIASATISSDTTTVPIYFWESHSSAYAKVNIDVSEVAPNLTDSTTACKISQDGTLALFFGNGQVIAVEIDKLNKTGIAHGVFSGGVTAILSSEYIYYNTVIYKYSKDTHMFKKIGTPTGATLSGNYYTLNFRPVQVSDNTWINMCRFKTSDTSHGKIYLRIQKFTLLDDGTFAYTYVDASADNFYPSVSLAPDGSYIATQKTSSYSTDSAYMYLYKFNVQDLSYTKVYSTDVTNIKSDGYKCGTDGHFVIVSTGLLYEITSTSVSTTKKYGIMPTDKTGGSWSSKKWLSSTDKLCSIASTEAEYIVTPNLTGATEEGKYYGVASHVMNVGDVGEAQLLFTT